VVRWLRGLFLALLPGCAAVPARAPVATPPAALDGPRHRIAPPDPHAPMVRLAFVLLDAPAMPDRERILAAFRAIAPPALGGALRVDDPEAAPSPEAAVFDLGSEGQLIVGLIDRPVPDEEAEFHAQFALPAVAEGWTLPPHRAHLMVFWREDPPLPARASVERFTWLLAAVTEASGALGVYWADSGATHPGEWLVRATRKADSPLLITIWSGVSVGSDGGNPDRVSLLSRGMSQLGLADLEVTVPSGFPKEDSLEFFYWLLRYEVQRGAPVPAGETVGRSAQERFPVRFVPSPVDPEKTVWRVDFPDAAAEAGRPAGR